MPPLVSVVVPVYNAEKMIESTLESIMSQDYPNLEIIVVNDASPDNSADIASRVLEKGSRPYRIIGHEKNRGVCAARNTGLFAAEGAYIHFMDDDDLIDGNFISSLAASAVGENSDIACCGYRTREISTGEETMYPLRIVPGAAYSGEDLAMMSISGKFLVVMWTSLFRKDFLTENGLAFTEGYQTGEDTEFIIKSLLMSARTSFVPQCLYVYRLHEKMVSRGSNITLEQILRRRESDIRSRLRTARFVMNHAKPHAIVEMAKYLTLPEMHLKMFTIHAWRGDRSKFDRALRSKEIRKILFSSRKVFFREPRIFLKSLWLYTAPNLYYNYRRRHVYRTRT
ncbi:MAG: glycosyltransferase [Synergistaceae bacterium]|jgi:glycosyltransferase involved in cell wall biosynthesis|nr:glycosyltransferase [Synergistaceae bacterium]